jgi:hypothetical protein
MRYLLALVLLVSATARSAPVPNLVLTCSDEDAIGQPQNACHGVWAYQVATNPLIVSAGPYGVWRVLGDLIGADTVFVCTLPVEPGQYSSCRDASGVRRMALVRKDSIVGGATVTVSKTGGDYSDPVTAAQNAIVGDKWCVAPHWPAQPCVMAIDEGVFVLHQTLGVYEQIVVTGAGKGATLLVADNGVETAVGLNGPARISDLTVVNTQVGGAASVGVIAQCADCPLALIQFHNVAVHVGGAARNTAVIRTYAGVEILDSEITAVGQNATGITTSRQSIDFPLNEGAGMTLERTLVAAEAALEQPIKGDMRLIDAHVFGTIAFNGTGSRLEIVRSGIVGNVTAANERVRVVITDSSIQGDVNANARPTGLDDILITNTNVRGNFAAGYATNGLFDRLTVHGQLSLVGARASVRGSYIINSASTAPALYLLSSTVQLQQTFVQGAQALAADQGRLEASSSVLAGPVSESGGAGLSCTDTYGADYELLTASCQPQPP